LLGEADRHRRRQIDVDVVGLQVLAVRNPDLQAQRLEQILLADGVHLDQDFAQQAALLRLCRDGLLDRSETPAWITTLVLGAVNSPLYAAATNGDGDGGDSRADRADVAERVSAMIRRAFPAR